jgi:predicted enzyme related to lactoylglutathione lyase
MTIRKVQLFSVPVTDQGRARSFYVDQLGFDVLVERPMGPDTSWLQLAPPGAETSITLVTWFDTMPAGSVAGIVLETDDLESDVDRLREQGVAIDGEIEARPWGRYVTFTDPDGNGLILQTPPTLG